MTIARVTDHADVGAANIIERYRKPLVLGLLRSWLDEVQEIEDALHAMLTGIIGRQPDVVGRIVGQPRDGRTDEMYWLWIRARIRANRSSGRTSEIIAIAQTLGVPALRYEEFYPATFVLHADAIYDWESGAQVATLLGRAKKAGVAAFFHWYGAEPFRFAPGATPVANSPNGFGNGAWSSISSDNRFSVTQQDWFIDDSDDIYTNNSGEGYYL